MKILPYCVIVKTLFADEMTCWFKVYYAKCYCYLKTYAVCTVTIDPFVFCYGFIPMSFDFYAAKHPHFNLLYFETTTKVI